MERKTINTSSTYRKERAGASSRRLASLILALVFTLCFAGSACIWKAPWQNGDQTAVPITEAPGVPSSAAPKGTEAPTAEPAGRSAADIAFEELAAEIVAGIVTSDGLSYHQLVVDPAAFDIDEAEVERGWGELSKEASDEGYRENDAALETLASIDREQLCNENRLAYDNMIAVLERSNALREYYYYDEPLTPFNGAHTMLPLMLSMYGIYRVEDIEGYLLLLEDMPRYLGDIEEFEKEKARLGLFMSENALDKVLASIRAFAEEGDSCFLLDQLELAIKAGGIELSAEDMEKYLERNRRAVIEGVLPAYERLAGTLEGLRSRCTPFTGAVKRGEEAKKHFLLELKNSAAWSADGDTMAELLDSTATDLISKLFALLIKDIGAARAFEKEFTSGSVERDVEYLLKTIEGIYPSIPEQRIRYVSVPDALAEDFSPAAYLVSAFDDPQKNVVIFNPAADGRTLLFTLAHECFPGHLYQTQYHRRSGVPIVQQVLSPSAYSEGWAVFSELMIAENAEKYNVDHCLAEQYNSIACNILLPAFVSIKVNSDGWGKSDISEHLSQYGLDQEQIVDAFYEYAVDMPQYFINYAMGFANTYRIYNSRSPRRNEERIAFFKEYLDFGPGSFDVLLKQYSIKE